MVYDRLSFSRANPLHSQKGEISDILVDSKLICLREERSEPLRGEREEREEQSYKSRCSKEERSQSEREERSLRFEHLIESSLRDLVISLDRPFKGLYLKRREITERERRERFIVASYYMECL